MVGSRRALGGSAVALILVAACGGGSPSGAPTQAPTVTAAPTQATVTAAPTQAASTTDPFALVAKFEGTYSGTWRNTTFGSTGPASIEIHLDRTAGTIGFTLTLGGNVFGEPAPAPETISATITPGQPVSFTSKTFGLTTIELLDGEPFLEALDVPSARIQSFEGGFSVDATGINFNYTVKFRDGSPKANGTAFLTKN